MPATTDGYVLGHNLRVWVDTVAVGNATSCSFKYDVDTKELSDKDVDAGATSPSAVALTLGKKRVSLTSSGFVVEKNGATTKTGGYKDLLGKMHAGTKIAWMYTTDAAGDVSISGDGYITSFGSNGDDGSEATYNIEIKSTGTITVGVAS